MFRTVPLVVLLCLPTAATAQENHDKPYLVLEGGGHTARVVFAAFARDDKEIITASEDKTVRVWSAETGDTLRVFRLPIGPGREGEIQGGALSPDGRLLALGGLPLDGVQQG